MSRPIKFEIKLKAIKPINGYKEGETVTIVNEIFHPLIGVAFHPIDKNFEIVFARQSIGVHSKSGREIYEGDVVKYYNKYSKKFYTHKVLWDNNWAAFGLFEDGNEWCKEFDWVKISEIEVLGNIYENPELLTN